MDYVIRIECGKRNSAIITNGGDIWVSGNYKAEKPAKEAIIKDKEETRKEEKKARGSFDMEEFLVKDKKGQKHSKSFKKGSKPRMFDNAPEEDMEEYWETYK
jgi:hypothetical protein